MNRTGLLVIGVCLAGTLLVSTGAVPLFQGPTDDISENVELYPSDSPDGKYAYIDDEGELVVDISASNPNVEGPVGVNPDTVTTFENVFRIRYNGSGYAEVWLTHESDAITFSARGEPIRSESAAVTLGPNESVGVDVHVDTTGGRDAIRADEMTVRAAVADSDASQDRVPEPGRDTDSVLGIATESEPDTGLVVTVTEPATGQRAVTIEDLTPGAVVDIDLDGLFIVDGAITLDGVRFEATAPGDANFTFSQRTAGSASIEPVGNERGIDALGYFTLNHTIPDSAVENVSFAFSARWAYLDAAGIDPTDVRLLRYGPDGWTVLETTQRVGTAERARFVADSPGLSAFAVGVPSARFVTTQATLPPTTIQVGETATVTATIENRGTATDRRTVTLGRNGSTVRNRTVALDAGANATVRFDVSPAAAGTYAYSVDGVRAGTLTVEPAATPVGNATTPTPTADRSAGQSPTETVPVSDEAAGFDLAALGGLVAVAVLAAAVAVLRRRREG